MKILKDVSDTQLFNIVDTKARGGDFEGDYEIAFLQLQKRLRELREQVEEMRHEDVPRTDTKPSA
jgi:hypothetical protein